MAQSWCSPVKSKSTNTAGFASGAVEQRRSSEMGSNASSIAASAASAADLGCEETVEFKTKDGWRIIGTLHIPRSSGRVPGVVLVHGSRHDFDPQPGRYVIQPWACDA